ncbi:MAG: hypothetical protein AB8B50_08535 [Pirellulaceae bacterium]
MNSDSDNRRDLKSRLPPREMIAENSTAEGDDLPPKLAPDQRISTPQTTLQSTLAVAEWFEDWLGSKAYGAPRIFDLYTLMSVMFAFALLFGGMRIIKPLLGGQLAISTVVVSLFLILTGVCQMLLWKGLQPRLASIVAGPFLWVGLGIFIALMDAGLFSSQPVRMLKAILPNFAGILCSSVIGIFVGYVSGGLVAGVFFIADKLRNSIRTPSSDFVPPANPDAMWDADGEDDDSPV